MVRRLAPPARPRAPFAPDPDPRVWSLLALGLAALGASAWFGRQAEPQLGFLRGAPAGCRRLPAPGGHHRRHPGRASITYLGVLFATFTVFTAISIFGVFLGTAAPIIALSVMSGFEADLKGKIRARRPTWSSPAATTSPSPTGKRCGPRSPPCAGVLASMPYIESEVMLDAAGPAGMVLRGIDPETRPAGARSRAHPARRQDRPPGPPRAGQAEHPASAGAAGRRTPPGAAPVGRRRR